MVGQKGGKAVFLKESGPLGVRIRNEREKGGVFRGGKKTAGRGGKRPPGNGTVEQVGGRKENVSHRQGTKKRKRLFNQP